ncbi:MAG: SEL1-like repeat protein [Magnetococcales bacterium]|nr:SEL1-like repeat protein [Magnetococcales bacterium]
MSVKNVFLLFCWSCFATGMFSFMALAQADDPFSLGQFKIESQIIPVGPSGPVSRPFPVLPPASVSQPVSPQPKSPHKVEQPPAPAPRSALEILRQSAEQGDATAQVALGALYDQGKGVPQNPEEAMQWYRKAAEQGNAVAQSNLGEMYYIGLGVPRDYAQAYLWTSLSAAQGNEKAIKYRDFIEKRMSQAEINATQEQVKTKMVAQGKPLARAEQVEHRSEPQAAVEPPPATVAPVDIEQTVRAWAKAWTSRKVEEYLAFYSRSFVPEKFPSREAWQKNRNKTLQSAGSIRVTLTDMKVTLLDENRAQVTFMQEYWSNNYQDKGRKTLLLQKEGDVWQIVREQS